MRNAPTVWREPDEESLNLYPGLVVHDGRVSGSITTGVSRLPLWAFMGCGMAYGWNEVTLGWEPEKYGWTQEKAAEFVSCLMELRGEFGRLLLVLADAERCDRNKNALFGKSWWHTKRHQKRVSVQLRRCLDALSPAHPVGLQEEKK